MWDMRATTRCRAAVVSMPEASTPARQIAADGIPAVDVVDLTKDYRRPRVSLTTPGPVVHALRGVSLQVAQGQRFGIVGESGCGKSTLLRILAGLEQPSSGRVAVMGQAVTGRTERSLRFLRENLQLVFQDPMSSLDPRMRVRDIVAEPLVGLRLGGDHAARVAELLSAVGLDPDVADRYPHQFSGGQRQRISIARALAPSPGILLADEPVSALDVSVRAQVLNVLSDLVDTYALTLVLVSHDLGVVRHVCGRVAVMKGGEIVETGPTAQVYDAPTHPYTQALVAAVPTIGKALSGERAADLAAGLSPLAASRLNPGYAEVVRPVTTRTVAASGATSYLVIDPSKVRVADEVADRIEAFAATNYADKNLTSNPSDPDQTPSSPYVIWPSAIRDDILSILREMEAEGLLQNVNAHAADVAVEINNLDNTVAVASVPIEVIPHFHSFVVSVNQVG